MNRVRKVARLYSETPRSARPVDLTGLNRDQLRSIAARKGVVGRGRMSPDQLRTAIAAS